MKLKKCLLYFVGFVMVSMILSGCGPILVAGTATGVVVARDPRSAGTMVDDQSIELKIMAKIYANSELSRNVHINAASYNGIVLLTGESPQAKFKDQAIEIARNIEKVKRVFSAVKVMTPTTLRSRNNDTWITSKIKTQLLGRKEIEGTQIKVITENGNVFLMGLISHKDAEYAASIASKIDGVKSVVKVFEFTD